LIHFVTGLNQKALICNFKEREIIMKKDTPKKHAHKDKESTSIKIAEPIIVDRRSRTDRKDEGKSMRLGVPLADHAQWQARPIAAIPLIC
jgi:hypothetical protein